jgi:MFS family permease
MQTSDPVAREIKSQPPLAYEAPMRATSVRWRVLALSVLMAILLYLDRFAINVVQPVVMKELGMSLTQMGFISTWFFLFYALFQVPAGLLGDRWGGRRAMVLFVAGWSLAFGLQALVAPFWIFSAFSMLCVLRVTQGVLQAGAYAVTASYLKNWIEPARRGFANGSVSMGGRAGGLLNNLCTPLVIAGLIPVMAWLGYGSTYEPGRWRETFLIYSGIGLVWAWIFWRWFRDTPAEHPGVNAAELAIINAGKPKAAPHKQEPLAAQLAEPDGNPYAPATPVAEAAPPPWAVLGNRNLWLLSTIMLFVNIGWIFIATSQTYYLDDVFQWSLVKAGSYAALTSLCGMTGCIVGGFATDYLVGRLGERMGRCLPGVIACGGAACMYLLAMTLKKPEFVVYAFAGVYFLNDFALGALWSAVQDVGRRNAGTMFGFINMSGNLGAAFFPPVIGILKEAGGWNTVFLVSAGAFVVSCALWFFVNPGVKLPETTKA